MIEAIDTHWMPSSVCLSCGSDTFSTHVRFDDEGTIAWYLTKHPTFVRCVICDSQVCLPTEIDRQMEITDATE